MSCARRLRRIVSAERLRRARLLPVSGPPWEVKIGPRARAPEGSSRWTAALAAGLLAVVLGAGIAAAQTGARIDEASKRALDDRSIQKTLPGASGTGQRQPDPNTETPRQRSAPPPEVRTSDSGGLGGISQTVLWIVAIVAGLALAYFVLRELLSLRLGSGKKRFEETDATVRARVTGRDEEGLPATLLDEADALAARGAFAEAIHVILMHSLGRLEEVSERAVGRSLTAREILRGSAISTRARELLGAIVGASEITHFGGRSAGEAEYRRCREAFQGFAAETGANA